MRENPLTLLVTGASGLLGYAFVRVAKQLGEHVIALSHRYPIEIEGVECVQADLSRSGSISPLLARYRPDWVIHCAAATAVDWCEDNPDKAWDLNAVLPSRLAESLSPEARMLYISTDSVFDGLRGNYSEADLPRPLNQYAKAKLAGETAVLAASPESLVVRTNIYGWNLQEKQSLAEWILGRLEEGVSVPAFRDVMFSPILVEDLSRLLHEMVRAEASGIYHVAGGEACSKYDFACRIARLFNQDPALVHSVSVEDAPFRAPRPRNMSLDTAKARGFFKRSLPGIDEGLRRWKTLRI